MKHLISCFLLSLLSSMVCAQPNIEWKRSLGGSKTDTPYAIRSTSDGGSIIAGYTYSTDGDVSFNHGERDFWVIKLDASGNIQWEKSLGGSSFDIAYSIQETSDGGYIVVGEVYSTDGDVTNTHVIPDAWVVKLTAAGDIQWQRTFGGSQNESAKCIQQTMDGGYIVGLTTESTDGDVIGNHGSDDIWLLKLSDIGEIQWQRAYGGSNVDAIKTIQLTTDGGYLISSHTCSNDGDVSGFHGTSDIWILKLSSYGDIIWQIALGGNDISWPGGAIQVGDSGYIVAGSTKATDGDVYGNHGAYDGWIVKLSTEGKIDWQKTIGGSLKDGVNSIQQTQDNGFVVAGYTQSIDGDVLGNHGENDIWVVKLDEAAEIQWQKTLGGSDFESLSGSIQAQDNGFILAGQTFSNDGDVSGNHGDSDCWVVKLSSEAVNIKTPITTEAELWEIFPNPANNKVFLKINTEENSLLVRITDAQGRNVSQQHIQNGEAMDVSILPNGFYSVVATSPLGMIFSNKLTIHKN